MAQALLGLEANNPKPKPVRPEVSKNRAECRSHGSSSVSAEHVEARRSSPAPVRAEVSKPCSESVIRCFGEPGAALSPRRATYLFLLRQNKVSQKKATLVPASLRFAPLRATCGAQPSRGLVQTRLRLKQARALIRLGFRSSAHSQGFWSRGGANLGSESASDQVVTDIFMTERPGSWWPNSQNYFVAGSSNNSMANCPTRYFHSIAASDLWLLRYYLK